MPVAPRPVRDDRVRIREAPETVERGLAGREGVVVGETIPSMSRVQPVIGDRGEDFAVQVDVEDDSEPRWYAPHLVELVGFEPGQVLEIGDRRWVRTVDGEWVAIVAPGETHVEGRRGVRAQFPPDRPAERSSADFVGRVLDRLWPGGTPPDRVALNKALVRNYLNDVWHAGKPASGFVTPDYRRHLSPTMPPLDAAAQQARIDALRAAFPDVRFTVEDIFAEGDRVVFRATMRGTHRGAFRGVEPTGRTIQGTVIDVVRIANGRIAEHWGGPDISDLLRQLHSSTS